MAKKLYVNLDFQGVVKGVNVVDPSAAQDIATKNYVDNAILGINNLLPARVRTTGNITIATALNSGDVIDGVTLANGDVVLVDQQTTPAEDGLYVVAASPARDPRLPAGDTGKGLAILVGEGTANGNQLWIQTAEPAVINTDGLTFSALAAGVTYTADGNGIELVSTTFSLELDGTTLSKSATGLRIGSGAAGAGLVEATGVLAVGAGTGITVNTDDVAVNTSTIARWNSALGAATAGSTIVQAHGLGSKKSVIVHVLIEATGEDITSGVDINIDTTNITVTFAASQADRSLYRVVWAG